jgi:DNA-binding PadR family transcriptional regulator
MPMVKLPLTLEHALLGFLWREPMYGYEIYQQLQEAHALGLVWHMKQSQLYALLQRLEDAGYLGGETTQQGNRPPRRLLALTDSGREAFRRWLATPVAHGREVRLEFLAKLFFANELKIVAVGPLIAEQRRVCREWLRDLGSQATKLEADPYDWLVLQFRIGQVEAILSWLNTCEARLTVPVPS